MRNTLKITILAVLTFSLFACGEKKLTQDDMKAAEKTLMNEDWTMNMDVAPQVAEKYCKFVEQNPDAPTSPTWLFHAIEINVALKNAEKSAELCNQLIAQYPESKWSPKSLMLLGSYLYEDQLNDTAMAHKAYQRLIDEFPNDSLVKDAKVLIACLGLSDEEKWTAIMTSRLPQIDVDDLEEVVK